MHWAGRGSLRLVSLLAAGLIAAAPCGQALAASPTAAQVVDKCKRDLGVTHTLSDSAYCTFLLRGYVDGYWNGAHRGARAAFMEDAQNLETTKGLADTTRRINALMPSARCMGPDVTQRQVAAAFIAYTESHSELSGRPYDEVLTDTVETYFCGDKR